MYGGIIYGEEHARNGCAGAVVALGIMVLFVSSLATLFVWQLMSLGWV